MMQFKGTNNLPSLDFDEEAGLLILTGRSTSVEKDDFWNPLIEKMDSYLNTPRDITMVIDFEYFNTTSAKSMLELFKLIVNKTKKNNKTFLIEWFYDDNDMMEAGEDYSSMIEGVTWKLIERREL